LFVDLVIANAVVTSGVAGVIDDVAGTVFSQPSENMI
jgi:hypothetical protein